jgi:hypothetical protein
MGIDFSVPESDLLQWLNNPNFTPYPAIAGALSHLIGNKRLHKPVFIDVIVFNYEHTTGVSSPRKPEDVNMPSLKRAILDGYNGRYGENLNDVKSLIIEGN